MKWVPLGALLAASLFAQSPACEVATIKPSPTVRRMNLSSVRLDRSQVSFNALPLSAVIAIAFRVHPSQIIGPDWLTSTGFNFTAKIPANTSPDQLPEMLQNLLVDRFQLKVRRENRDLQAYILTAGKRGLPPADSDAAEIPADDTGDNATVVQTPLGEMKVSSAGNRRQIAGSGVKVTMVQGGARIEMSTIPTLVKLLSADADFPVVDQTGLTGKYRIVLNMQDGPSASPVLNPELNAVEEQLGLKVTPSKAPLEAIVIDHIEKTPAGN